MSFNSLGFLGFFAAVTALYLTGSVAMIIVDKIWGGSTRYARVYRVRRWLSRLEKANKLRAAAARGPDG